jgi:hypothetical protein
LRTHTGGPSEGETVLDKLLNELSGRGLGVVIGLVAGGLITLLVSRWRRHRQRQSVMRGDARDTVVIHHHLVEPGPPASRS